MGRRADFLSLGSPSASRSFVRRGVKFLAASVFRILCKRPFPHSLPSDRDYVQFSVEQKASLVVDPQPEEASFPVTFF